MEDNDASHLQPDVLASRCPSRLIFKRLTSQWSGLVLIVLLRNPTLRFSALRRSIQGISEKMLAQTLRGLESDGFVIRTAYPEVPPRVEYSLSALGQSAATRLHELVGWLESSLPEILEAQEKFRDERS